MLLWRTTGALLARRAPPLALAVLTAAAQQPASEPFDLGGEGPLRNDTFLPQSAPAEQALARGDRAWSEAQEGVGRADGTAFDAWLEALAASATGEGVRLALEGVDPHLWPDPDRTAARRVEGVEVAVLRRLAALDPGSRERWRARAAGLADAALAAAGGEPEALAALERRYPATRAAGVAALRLADAALEAGRPTSARTWIARCRAHVAGWPADADVEAALGARERAALALAPPRAPDEAWRHAGELELVRSERLETRRVFARPTHEVPLGRSLEPGAAFLSDGDLVVQGPQTLSWLDTGALEGPDAGRAARIPWSALVADASDPRPFAAPSAGGWPLLPVARDRTVVAVVDRGQAGRRLREVSLPARGNHLLCLAVGEDGRVDWVWRLSDGGLERADGFRRATAEALGVDGRFELQPGPVLLEDLVVVQARRLPQPSGEGVFEGGDLWLFALGALDGELAWARRLTDAADLQRDLGRSSGRSEVPTTGMPLAVLDGVLVVGTNVGLVLAFDAADGRLLWGVRNQRREVDEDGWPGSRPPIAWEDAALVTPFDSEFAYLLPLRPVLSEALFRAAPRARGELLDWAAAGEHPVLLGRSGRHHALLTSDRAGEPVGALHLDEGERFAGRALVSERRALVASDRCLYLFDRESELLLLDSVPLPDLQGGTGGSVFARGERVVVVGADTLWVLRAR